MAKSPEHRISKDGSSTLYSPQFGQYYHNPNGAVSESRHVFFDIPGLSQKLNPETESLVIFEVGFGTGLNFLLLFDEYLKKGLDFPVHFYSVEAFPVDANTTSEFNYQEFLLHPELAGSLTSVFERMEPGMNHFIPMEGKEVHLHIFYGLFEELPGVDHPADFFFHDPFSPEVNETLWTVETFRKLKELSHSEAILATYCAASKARAAMASAGWFVARAPGALGKREMTVASLSEIALAGFKRLNEERLTQRLASGEF